VANRKKKGHGAVMVDDRKRSVMASARRAGLGSGDPGVHAPSAADVSTTRRRRKARAGTTTAGKDRRAGSGGMAPTMKNKRVAPSRAQFAAEGSAGARPSRKSTRKGANRIKENTQLTRRAQRQAASPEMRARRSKASRTRVRG